MKNEQTDFIGIFKNVYPEGYCQHLINEFDRLTSMGAGSNRIQSENEFKYKKDDFQIEFNLADKPVQHFNGIFPVRMFFDGLQRCYDMYSQEYSILTQGKTNACTMKLQRTDPGGGYHIWHSEQGNGVHANRVLAYMLYLNTLNEDEAGETEFLYQQRRIKPEENTMVIWPATFTHAHRGNTVFGERSKYIATGWFYYE